MIKQRSSIPKLLTIMAFSMATVGGIYYYRAHYAAFIQQGPISEYDAARGDKEEIVGLFKSDLYWLSANDDYDAAYMLDNRAPSKQDMHYFGKMAIKVLRDNDQFVGFVAYYKKSGDEGFINFVCVKPEMRGKRYAEQLMRYAEQELRAMGVHKIRLLTRTSNHRARALYTRLGYTISSLDDIGGFVYYMKVV